MIKITDSMDKALTELESTGWDLVRGCAVSGDWLMFSHIADEVRTVWPDSAELFALVSDAIQDQL